MDFLKKNKKIIIPVAIVIGVIGIGIAALSAQVNSDKIAKNIEVSGIDISDLNKREAIKKLESQ